MSLRRLSRIPLWCLGVLAAGSLLATACVDASSLVASGSQSGMDSTTALDFDAPGEDQEGSEEGGSNGPQDGAPNWDDAPFAVDESSEEEPWNDLEVPEIADGVLLLDDHPCFEGFEDEEETGDLSLFYSCAAETAGLANGLIVVSGREGGLLRRLETVDVEEDQAFATTSPALLVDVLREGGFDEHIQLGDARYGFDYSGTSLYDNGTVSLQLSDAVVNLQPDLHISADFGWFSLERARAVLDLDFDLDLELLAQIQDSASASGSVPLGSATYPFAFAAGPVPVTGTLSLSLKAGFTTSAEAQIEARVGTEVDGRVKVGGRYHEDSGWTFTRYKRFDAVRTGPSISAEGSWDGKVYVQVDANLRFYRVAGPSFYVQPYLRGEADAACWDLDWGFYGGGQTGAGLHFDTWLFNLSKNFGPWTWERALGQGTIPLETPLGTNCGPSPHAPAVCEPAGTISCGQTVSGDTTSSANTTSALMAYPVNVGNYDAAEVTYVWQATTSNEVELSLVDPSPTLVNHDVIVLDGDNGQCLADQAVDWGFNSLRFTPTAGSTYYVVVDGYDGDTGAFQLQLDCAP